MDVMGVTGVKRAREDPVDPSNAAKKPTGGAAAAANGGGQANIDKDLKNAALDYLEQVKTRFENHKEVYDKFLDIMKDFQSRILETSGVIKRVSDLFKGERNLILGFNAFLPEGYKITEEMYQNELSRQREKAMQQARQSQRAKRAPNPSRQAAAAAAAKKPPELEYAKNYVSKIRKRFKHSPKTYQQFLNILQNYQEEQKTVKEVYEQVQRLFQGHNDLLTEFARFLPDPDAPVPPDQPRAAKPTTRVQPRKPPARRGSKDEEPMPPTRREKPRFSPGPGFKDEMEFFKQFKSRAEPGQWEAFVKLLNMFNNQVVSATELKVMIRELFQKPQRIYNQNAKRRANEPNDAVDSPDLYEGLLKFFGMLCGSASIFEGKKAAPKELHRSVHDREAGGPSYMCRAQTTLAVCYGRGMPEWQEVCDEVLNDQYGLNPLGSEQSAVLTNTHEMALFRAEDERYELDTMIGRTSMAIGQLEPVAEQLSKMSRAEKQQFELYDRVGLLPMRTIHKIYGEHGNEMMDTLYDNPAAAIPIILARLKQKDLEYRTVRHQQNRLWQEVFEQNYHKALDHRSYAFKVQDKKALHTKSILLALREIPEGITFRYPVPVQDTQLWFVLNKHIRDLVDESEARVMTTWWEGWFAPFLGAEVIIGPEAGAGKEGEVKEKRPSRRGSVQDPTKQKVLYANHTMATMLRLHQMLHQRMIEAKNMAEDERNEAGPSRENQMMGPETPRDVGFSVSPQTAAGATNRRNQDPYQAFINCLLSMLRGHLDINKYEDECRTLLGTSSYKLFTLDKLIPRLIKETNNLSTSESWRKIKAAYNQSLGISEDGGKCEVLSQQEYRWRMCEEFHHNCFEVLYDPVSHEMTLTNVALSDEIEGTNVGARRGKPELEQHVEHSAEGSEIDEAAAQAAADGEHSAMEDGDDGVEVAALLKMNEKEPRAAAESEQDKEEIGGVDSMEVDEDEQAPQEPLIRRPTLGYGDTGKQKEDSEEESDT